MVKTYRGKDAKDYFNVETHAFKALFNGNNPATNVVGFYHSFVRGDIYNLVLEYADRGTLEDLMKNTWPPDTGPDIRVFWQQLFELLRGLSAIHNLEWNGSGPRVMMG